MPPSKRLTVSVDGHELSLSNLDKVLYPEVGFTKGQVIDYYTRVAPYVLAHLRGRPLTLKRYPNGVDQQYFYEKNIPVHAPDWVPRQAVKLRKEGGKSITFVKCDDLPTLVWLANLADLELHTSMALAADIGHPTILAFDLDPGPPATVVDCCAVACRVREVFDSFGMQSFPKTSGSKGMQVYVPLNVPGAVTHSDTKTFARSVALLLENRDPKRVVSEMRKDLRTGKVFIDWSQNDEHKTTVAVYSLRAKSRPTVSTPLTWDEVEDGASARDPEELAFEAGEVLDRCAEHGDLFAPVATLEQELPRLGG